MAKDLKIAKSTTDSLGVKLPAFELMLETYE